MQGGGEQLNHWPVCVVARWFDDGAVPGVLLVLRQQLFVLRGVPWPDPLDLWVVRGIARPRVQRSENSRVVDPGSTEREVRVAADSAAQPRVDVVVRWFQRLPEVVVLLANG